MEWARKETHDVTVFLATASDETEAAATESAAAACDVMHREVLPRHRAEEWDLLRLEVWADTARVFMFPAKSHCVERTDRALVEMTWPSLANVWTRYALPASDDEEELEAQVGAASRKIVHAFRRALLTAGWAASIPVECYLFGEERICTLKGEQVY